MEKEVIHLKESEEEYMEGFGWRKGKEEMLQWKCNLKKNTPNIKRYMCASFPGKLVKFLWRKKITIHNNPDIYHKRKMNGPPSNLFIVYIVDLKGHSPYLLHMSNAVWASRIFLETADNKRKRGEWRPSPTWWATLSKRSPAPLRWASTSAFYMEATKTPVYSSSTVHDSLSIGTEIVEAGGSQAQILTGLHGGGGDPVSKWKQHRVFRDLEIEKVTVPMFSM